MSSSRWEKVKQRTLEGHASNKIKRFYKKKDPVKILIYNNLCPGDNLCMEPSLRMIQTQYPGRFLLDVATFHHAIFENHPHLTKLEPKDPDVIHLWSTYPLINKSHRPIHFMEGYLDWFRQQLDIDLVLDTNRPQIYLTDKEKSTKIMEGKYIVGNMGWKSDYTIKRPSIPCIQEVVNHFKSKLTFVQIGLNKKGHHHPPLDNVVNMIGKTNLRQLILLCYFAQAGMGTITCIQHMFAAFEKPYCVFHGAREPITWTAYPLQKVFSNIGSLECCRFGPCWKNRIVPLNDGDKKDKRLCVLPVLDTDDRPIATCMQNIKSQHVIDAIEAWIDGGIIETNNGGGMVSI